MLGQGRGMLRRGLPRFLPQRYAGHVTAVLNTCYDCVTAAEDRRLTADKMTDGKWRDAYSMILSTPFFLTVFMAHTPSAPYPANGRAIPCKRACHTQQTAAPFAGFQIVISMPCGLSFLSCQGVPRGAGTCRAYGRLPGLFSCPIKFGLFCHTEFALLKKSITFAGITD